MSSIQHFDFNSSQVRIVFIDGEPWFVAKDVCNVLEVGNVGQALSRLDDDEVKQLDYQTIITLNDDPSIARLSAISESGLYSLTLSSRKPQAKDFKRWVTREVLPSIRKTGGYGAVNPEVGKKAIHYYSDRVMDLPKKLQCPAGRWTVIEESSFLLIQVESMGWEVNRFDLLDGSVGIKWGHYREELGLPSVKKDAPYQMDGRGTFNIHSFPYSELGIFKQWLREIYMTTWMPKYLEKKSKALARQNR